MNHAKKISCPDKTAQIKGTGFAPSQVGRVLQVDAKTKRSGGTAKGQEKVGPANHASNAFLKMRFYTRLRDPAAVGDRDQVKLQRDFYKSLHIMTKKLGITVTDTKGVPYPYNIAAALTDLKNQLDIKDFEWTDVRLIHDKDSTYFAKEERYDTGMILYYIPVVPLYTILQREETKNTGLLLLSLYAYLYHVLRIPYYREEGCYLYSMYETLEEWAKNDRASKNTFKQIKDAKIIGDRIKELIHDPLQLKSFGKRLRSFKPRSSFDNSCFIICQRFYLIYRKYGKIPIDHNFYPIRFREGIEDDARPVMLDDYVSFCASLTGDLFETLLQTAADEFQEYSEIEEPVRFIPYNEKDIDNGNFDFETAVFGGIDDLLRLWHESGY